MKRARFIAPARREFLAEVAFYNEEEAELASRFATAVEEAVARAVMFPLTGLTRFDEYAPGLRGELSLRCCVSPRPGWHRHLCTGSSLASSRVLAVASSGTLTNAHPSTCSARAQQPARVPASAWRMPRFANLKSPRRTFQHSASARGPETWSAGVEFAVIRGAGCAAPRRTCEMESPGWTFPSSC